MLDYTKTAIRKTFDDYKRVDYYRNIITQLLYVAYLVYAVCTKTGFIWVDVALLALSVSYFIFFMIMTRGKPLAPVRKVQKSVAVIFRRSKQLLKLFTLGVMLYGVYFTTQNVTVLSVLFSALMIVGWILQIVFEVLMKIFIARGQLIIEALEADFEGVTKPVKAVGNFFKKITGKEVEAPKEKSKNRVWLDKEVEEYRAEKKEKKKRDKQDRKQEKQDRKRANKAAKRDAKNTVFLSPIEEEKPSEPTPLHEVQEEPILLPPSEETPPTKKEKNRAKAPTKKAD